MQFEMLTKWKHVHIPILIINSINVDLTLRKDIISKY